MSPPNKRKRSNSPDNQPTVSSEENAITRSESCYFEDGNIVLIAEDVAFRVHKSVIGRQSEVFRDMLALGDQPMNAETFDGFPAVRLSDSKADILVLLIALYDGTQLDAEDVIVMAALLRMSNKYLIDALRTYAMHALGKIYPDSLSAWDQYKIGQSPEERLDRGETWAVLDLVGADILLPAVHYDLCGWKMSQLVGYDVMPPQHILQKHCAGREIIATKFANFIEAHVVGRVVGADCTNKCGRAWTALENRANKLLRLGEHNIVVSNPLNALETLSQTRCIGALCANCQAALFEKIRVEREEIWTSLPETFAFESWEQLGKTS